MLQHAQYRALMSRLVISGDWRAFDPCPLLPKTDISRILWNVC
jgi:hypothetical protein